MEDIKTYIKSSLRNPLTEYVHFLSNWWTNKFKFKNFKQGYLSIVTRSDIKPYVNIFEEVRVTASTIDSYTYISRNSRISQTMIGKFCSIGPNCTFGLGSHPSQGFVSSHPIFFSTLKQTGITFADQDYFDEIKYIKIGNDVWIGANVLILDGVSIGDGSIIAAGAVVNKDVPPYSIYGGIPAKLIRYKFDEETINFLLKFQWWNKDEKWLRDNFKQFHNIDAFRKKYENQQEDKKT